MALRYYSSVAVATDIPGGCTSGATSIDIGAATGLPSNYPYTFILDPETVDEEVVEVTNRSGTTLTVTRGVDGTSAVAHSAGAVARHGFSARDFADPAVGGLQGVASGTFSTASSFDITGFSSTYSDYRLIMRITGSTNIILKAQLKVSGTPSTANYSSTRAFWGTSSGTDNDYAGSDEWMWSVVEGGNGSFFGLDLSSVALAEYTHYHGTGLAGYGGFYGTLLAGIHYVATAYDSITVTPDTGTISGRWALFGYRAV